MLLDAPMCLSCTAKLRTPLYCAPGMLRLSGEKLNFSSGIASATSRISFSTLVICRSTTDATVGAGAAVGCVSGRLVPTPPAPPKTPASPTPRILFIVLPPLALAVMAPDGIEQLLRVVTDAVLEDDLDVLDVRDARRRVALDHDQVRVLPGRDRTDLPVAAEEDRAVQRRDPDRLDRREPGLDQQLDFPLIAEARDHAAIADRVGSREQQAAGGDEGALQLHLAAKQERVGRLGRWIGGPAPADQVRLARGGRHRLQRRRPRRGPAVARRTRD